MSYEMSCSIVVQTSCKIVTYMYDVGFSFHHYQLEFSVTFIASTSMERNRLWVRQTYCQLRNLFGGVVKL